MPLLVSSQELTLLYTFQGCLNQLETLWADQRLPRDEAEGMMDHKWRRGDVYLTVVVVTRVYTYTETNQVVHLKYSHQSHGAGFQSLC